MRQKNSILILVYFALIAVFFQSCGPNAEQIAQQKSLDSLYRADSMAIFQKQLLQKIQLYASKAIEEILKKDSIGAIKKKQLPGVRLIPIKINYSNVLLSINMTGIPSTVYSKDGIVICTFKLNGNFATGAIVHFYFKNIGAKGKSKFIVILDATVGMSSVGIKAKVVNLDLQKGTYSLDVYLAFDDNAYYKQNASYQDRIINVKLTSPKELFNDFSFITKSRSITVTKVVATLIDSN